MNMYLSNIKDEQFVLANHPIFAKPTIQNKEELRIFMESHVYAVWDFMSLLKSLQRAVVPTQVPWIPNERTRSPSARLINEIVMGEESDEGINGGSTSHFDLYCQSMREVGADTTGIETFLETVKQNGIATALELAVVPQESRDFMRHTFSVINSGNPHVIASVFCFSRETLITDMFSALLAQLKIKRNQAPRFYYYLERHIEIDGDAHGPASLELIRLLCDNDPSKVVEAEQAAIEAIYARIRLWDAVTAKIKSPK